MGLFFSVSDGPDIGDEPEKASEEKVILVDVDNLDSVIGTNLFSEPTSAMCSNTACGAGASCMFWLDFDCMYLPEGESFRCWESGCDW